MVPPVTTPHRVTMTIKFPGLPGVRQFDVAPFLADLPLVQLASLSTPKPSGDARCALIVALLHAEGFGNDEIRRSLRAVMQQVEDSDLRLNQQELERWVMSEFNR